MTTESENIEELKKMLDFFTSIPLRGANIIKTKYLSITEDDYQSFKSFLYPNSREYYIFGVLKEVLKAGIALMETANFITESKKQDSKNPPNNSIPDKDFLSDCIYSYARNNLSIWRRKLIELLIDVAGFKIAKDPIYFKHYLLLKERQNLERTQKDFKEFYKGHNLNYEYQISQIEDQINALLPSLDFTRCFYVDVNPNTGPNFHLSTFESKLKRILPNLTIGQRVALGFSQAQFSETSSNIHPDLEPSETDDGMDDLKKQIGVITILSGHLLLIIKDMLRKNPKKGFLKEIGTYLRKENKGAVEVYDRTVRPDLQIGDFVAIHGDLGEVVRVNISKYGYRSFKVKYLSGGTLSHIKADTFPSVFTRRLYRGKDLKKEIKQKFGHKGSISSKEGRKIASSVRKSVIDFWEKMGLRESVNGRPELAQQKLKEFIESLNKDNKKK